MSDFDKAMLAAGLNRSQRHFCKMPVSHCVRLLAPAGSGKTYSLLWRCRFIAEEKKAKGREEPNFLIVTFTRAAKHELEQRLNTIPDFQELKVTVSTLNAWGWGLLKTRTGKELITSAYSRKSLITHDLLPISQKFEPIAKALETAKGKAANAPILIDCIDLYKSLGFRHTMSKAEYNAHVKYLRKLGLSAIFDEAVMGLQKMMGSHIEDDKEAQNVFWNFWKAAVKQLESINRFTLEDQKYWAVMALKTRIDEKRYAGTSRYTHIMVDEFQDINPLDIELIKSIALYHGKGKIANLTIVGDDDQAIFGWRGTTPNYILYPEKYFECPFDTAILDTNYRSPESIIVPANKLIAHNRERVPKEVKTVAKGRASVKVVSRERDIASINTTVNLVHELIEKKGCERVAIIARKQSELFPYQVIFSSENLRYHIAADIDIFEGEAVKSLQSILKIIYRAKAGDCDDPVDAILTICDKVYRYQLQTKEKNALKQYLARTQSDTFEEALDALKLYPELIKNNSAEALYTAAKSLLEADSVADFMSAVLENLKGFEQDYKKADKDVHYKNPQFERLKELSKKYGSDFLRFSRDIEKARKNSEYSRDREKPENEAGWSELDEIKLYLLTATRSKGLEFDAVIILEAQDDVWPAALSENIEEERRLFYVAMTRAKKYLYFMTVNGKRVSRFLTEAGL